MDNTWIYVTMCMSMLLCFGSLYILRLAYFCAQRSVSVFRRLSEQVNNL